jgi:sporulation protein YlmC with PRC-barrel domain
MRTSRLGLSIGAAAMMALAGSSLAALAQSQPGVEPPASSSTGSGLPPAAKVPPPSPDGTAAARTEAKPGGGTAAAPVEKGNEMVGMPVFGSDGERVGRVAAITADPGGKVTEIEVTTGGFLGFGAKVVKIPSDKATNAGRHIQLSMTSEQIKQLVN